MKTFKYTIANTLPDQRMGKYSKNVLKKYRDQINAAFPFISIKYGNEDDSPKIGIVKEASYSNDGLKVILEVETETIDKQWEYFFVLFVPENKKHIEIQGRFEVITGGRVTAISMVRSPTDMTLKPVTFFEDIKENQDYFIKHYEELDELTVKRVKKSGEQTYVYYPVSVDPEDLITDAKKRGLVIDREDGTGETLRPFNIDSFGGTFDQFREYINALWKIQIENMGKTANPLKKVTKAQS